MYVAWPAAGRFARDTAAAIVADAAMLARAMLEALSS